MPGTPTIQTPPSGLLLRTGARGLPAGQGVAVTAPAVAVVLTPDSAATQIMAPSADITVTLGSAVTMSGQSVRLSNVSPTGNTLTLVRHADDGGTNLAVLAAGADVHIESTGTVPNNWQFVTQTPSAFMNAVAVPDATNVQLADAQGPVIVATKAAGPGASQLRLPAFSLARLRQRIWTIILDNTASGAAVGGGNEVAILSLRTSTGAPLVPAINVSPGSRRLVTVGFDGAGAYIPFDAYNLENVRALLQGPQTAIAAGAGPTIYNILPSDSFSTVDNTAGGDLSIELPLATGSGRLLGFNFLNAGGGGAISFGPAVGDQIQGGGANVDFPYNPLQNGGVVWLRDHGTQEWRFDFVDAGAVITQSGTLATALASLANQKWTMPSLGAWRDDQDGAFTNGGGLVGDDVLLTVEAANRAWAFDNGTATFTQLSLTAGSAEYTNNFQLFPDVPSNNDAVYFGSNVPFPEIAFNMAVVQTAVGTNVPFTWEYFDGAGWSALSVANRFFDNTTTGVVNTGVRSFERDGAITFEMPPNWAQTDPGMGQAAFWIRCRAAVAADIGIVGTLVAEHSLVTPADGWQAVSSANITNLRVSTGGAAGPTAPVFFMIVDLTQGTSTGVLTFGAGKRADSFALGGAFSYTAGDILGIYCTADGGGASFVENAIIELLGTLA